MIVTLPLTNYTDKLCFIDYEDLERCLKHKWCFSGSQIMSNIEGKTITLSRFITGKQWIDHKDRNIFHNCKRNFRKITMQQNMFNKSKHNNCTSKFKGVNWSRKRNKWEAYICVNYIRKGLGRFNSEIEAAEAYNKAALEHFGEFAVLNTF